MSSKSIVIGAGFVTLVLVILLIQRPPGRGPASHGGAAGSPGGETVTQHPRPDDEASARGAWRNPRAERAAAESATNFENNPSLHRQRADLVLSNAVRCVAFIDTLIDAVPPERGNTRRQLEGMRKKMFEDDWRLAALHDRSIRAAAAAEAFQRLAQNPREADISSLREEFRSSEETESGDGITSLTAHYQRLLASHKPVYREIVQLLDDRTGSPGQAEQSALLKDAATYVAFRTQVNGWWEEEQRLYRGYAAEVAQDRKTASSQVPLETFDAVDAFHDIALQEAGRGFQSQLEASDRVFEWRFRELYGLDGAALLAALSELKLVDPSPVDLSIPGP